MISIFANTSVNRFPPIVTWDSALISACVITHNHREFENRKIADRIKQFVNNPIANGITSTVVMLPST